MRRGGERERGRTSIELGLGIFFQAEDGIRDLTVTGVQTCALPIWLEGRLDAIGAPTLVLWGEADRWIPIALGRALAAQLNRSAFLSVRHAGRSEERRGGKECRSRWSPDH